jgi:hypothetical protein
VLATVQASVAAVSGELGTVVVRVDCAPSVVFSYAKNIGTTSPKFRSAFLGTLADTIAALLGASNSVRESTDTATGASGDEEQSPSGSSSFSPLPLKDLYCGGGFAFKLTVDVQVMQCNGGSIVSAASYAIRGALASLKLPFVIVSESPMGYSVEVNKTKPFQKIIDWSEAPIALSVHTQNSRFLIDPSLSEEASLPLHVIVAFGWSGRLSFLKVCAQPSKRVESARFTIGDLRQLVSDAAVVVKGSIAAFDQQLKA